MVRSTSSRLPAGPVKKAQDRRAQPPLSNRIRDQLLAVTGQMIHSVPAPHSEDLMIVKVADGALLPIEIDLIIPLGVMASFPVLAMWTGDVN